MATARGDSTTFCATGERPILLNKVYTAHNYTSVGSATEALFVKRIGSASAGYNKALALGVHVLIISKIGLQVAIEHIELVKLDVKTCSQACGLSTYDEDTLGSESYWYASFSEQII